MGVLVGVLGILFVILLVAGLVVSRIKVAGPNEAFIVTGRKGRAVRNPETGQTTTDLSGQKVVMGASVFVVPFVQRLAVLDLTSRQILVSVPAAISQNGIKCSLEAVAVVKVGGSEDLIRAAAQRFLGQQEEIDVFTKEVLAGSLRAIVGRLSVEEIIRDRAAFASAVAEEAESGLTNQGLVLDTFQLQDIQTEGNYLRDLGRPEAARAEMEAAVAEAAARREAEQARLKAEEEIALAQRALALKQAEIRAQTDAAMAEAAAAGPLAQAARDREVIAAQELVAQRKSALKERELDTEVRKPADAERYAVEQQAEGDKNAAIAKAEAEKQATIAAAQARAEESRLVGAGERQRREELAQALETEGRAEASAILSRGEAEAQAMRRKAESYERYGSAAVADLLAQVLPKVVRAAAEPLSAVDRMTIVSTDGASALTKNVSANVAQGIQVVSDLTGVDLLGLFSNLAGRGAGGPGGNGAVDGDSTASARPIAAPPASTPQPQPDPPRADREE